MYTQNQYSKSRKILSKKVPGQYIFAEYFLHTNKQDKLFNKLLEEEDLEKIPPQMLDSRVNHYVSKLKTLEQRSDHVASWKDYPKFEFFQFVISNKDLYEPLEGVDFEFLQELSKKIENGEITVDKAFQMINLDPNSVASFVATMIDDFKMGDD